MGDCILWDGPTNEMGYGRFKRNGVSRYAHRVAWEKVHGPIPEGKQINHHCDVPGCVNVEHLYLGTQADNIRDRVVRGRSSGGGAGKAKCSHGHPYTPENTYVRPDGNRGCKECRREQNRRTAERRKHERSR